MRGSVRNYEVGTSCSLTSRPSARYTRTDTWRTRWRADNRWRVASRLPESGPCEPDMSSRTPCHSFVTVASRRCHIGSVKGGSTSSAGRKDIGAAEHAAGNGELARDHRAVIFGGRNHRPRRDGAGARLRDRTAGRRPPFSPLAPVAGWRPPPARAAGTDVTPSAKKRAGESRDPPARCRVAAVRTG